MHKREAIRNEIIDIIDLRCPTVAGRVFKGRVYPMDDAALPGVCVYVGGESGSLITTATAGSARLSQRILEININIYVKGSADITETLNDIAAEIEVAMSQDVTITGLALDNYASAWSESLNADQTDRAQGKKTGVGLQTYEVLYQLRENNPEG